MVEEVESEVPAKMKRPLPCGILQGVHPHAEAVHAKPSDERRGVGPGGCCSPRHRVFILLETLGFKVLADAARHVIECHANQEARVQGALDDVASNIRQALQWAPGRGRRASGSRSGSGPCCSQSTPPKTPRYRALRVHYMMSVKLLCGKCQYLEYASVS